MINAEINKKTSSVSRLFHAKKTKFIGKAEILKKIKMSILKNTYAYVPVLTYGAETWDLTEKHLHSL